MNSHAGNAAPDQRTSSAARYGPCFPLGGRKTLAETLDAQYTTDRFVFADESRALADSRATPGREYHPRAIRSVSDVTVPAGVNQSRRFPRRSDRGLSPMVRSFPIGRVHSPHLLSKGAPAFCAVKPVSLGNRETANRAIASTSAKAMTRTKY